MTLAEALGALVSPDHFKGGALLPLDIKFDTAGERDLQILSVYYHDGVIRVDIGSDCDR